MAEYTAISPDGKYLFHYGVKGMQWGKKKTKKDYQSNKQESQFNKSAKQSGDTIATYAGRRLPKSLESKTWAWGQRPTNDIKKDSGSSIKSMTTAPETKEKKKKKRSSTKRTSNFKNIGRSNNTKN